MRDRLGVRDAEITAAVKFPITPLPDAHGLLLMNSKMKSRSGNTSLRTIRVSAAPLLVSTRRIMHEMTEINEAAGGRYARCGRKEYPG